MKQYSITLILLLQACLILAQTFRHYDYLGGGHKNEVTVTASSGTSAPITTVDGFEIQNQERLKDASRFLAQCTFGADMPTIQMVAAMGKEAWLDEQFALPIYSYANEMYEMMNIINQEAEENDEEEEIIEFPEGYQLLRAWTHINMTAPDLLRHRMAFILSQIFVINDNSDLFMDFGDVTGTYYDLLYNNSFGNYEKLLTDVTMSPAMGLFLSHYSNPKADPANNIHPDENYAREIMQLFSIGLWELNPDGTRKYDANGSFIPTYTNTDIKEFAQVFTGLSDGRPNGSFRTDDEEDEISIYSIPMKMYEEYHDDSSKELLNGVVLPAGQSGMQDILQTMNHLSTHPNTAPFIAKSLIKFLTTSNPSRAYVQRVASKFNPSREGNFREVIKAILLDPDARQCEQSESYTFGKLKEPLVRYMNYMKAFPTSADENGKYTFGFECLGNDIGQSPLKAPSVFNFFQPDYRPQSSIEWNYLVGPEFQILNSTNSIGILNEADRLTVQNNYFVECFEEFAEDEEEDEEFEYEEMSLFRQDYSTEINLSSDPDALIERLNILLAHGGLSDDTKTIIRTAVDQLSDPVDKLKMASYLIMISPDYAILK